MATDIQFRIEVPPAGPEETAQFVTEVLDALRSSDALVRPTVSFTQEPQDNQQSGEFTVEDQLDRFGEFWRTREKYLRAVHAGLVETGYRPVLPDTRRDNAKLPAPYIRYVDPVSNATLGTTNSGAFLFVGQQMKDRLDGHEAVTIGRDGARIQFENDEKVALILDIAREAKTHLPE